jgi:DNA-binding CsgD family transcriptional regulator
MPPEEPSLAWIHQYYNIISSKQNYPELLDKIKAFNEQVPPALELGPSFYAILDYTDYQYKYVSDAITDVLGYSPQRVLEDGLTFFSTVVRPEDQFLITKNWEIIPSYCNSLPMHILMDSCYTSDWHIKHGEGHWVHMMQQTIKLETDDEGRFLYEFFKYTDITHWQKQSHVCAMLTTPDPQYNLLYFPKEEYKIQGQLFSQAELKVLELLANGEKSKAIAEQLHLSPHTVDTHRRNMLRKTKSSNTQDLIRMAYLSGSL